MSSIAKGIVPFSLLLGGFMAGLEIFSQRNKKDEEKSITPIVENGITGALVLGPFPYYYATR